MTNNTETIRDAAEVLDTLTSTLAVDHPLRTQAAARAKSCVSGLYSAADTIDAQSAEIAAQARHANFLNAEIARLRFRIAELREALNCTWMALEDYLPDHRNDVTDRAIAMARAALAQEGS